MVSRVPPGVARPRQFAGGLTIPHYRRPLGGSSPWALAIWLGVYCPITGRMGPGVRIVGGRLWVIMKHEECKGEDLTGTDDQVCCQCGERVVTVLVQDRREASPSVSHSQTPLHPRPIATHGRV